MLLCMYPITCNYVVHIRKVYCAFLFRCFSFRVDVYEVHLKSSKQGPCSLRSPLGSILAIWKRKIYGIVAIQFPDGNDDDVFVMHSDPIGGLFYAILLCYNPQSTLLANGLLYVHVQYVHEPAHSQITLNTEPESARELSVKAQALPHRLANML